MGATWVPKHVDGGWWAMRGRRIAGEVVWYHDEQRQVYWAAFAGRERIPGRFATDDDARAATDNMISNLPEPRNSRAATTRNPSPTRARTGPPSRQTRATLPGGNLGRR